MPMPRCHVCYTHLRPDGSCVYHCPPELANPHGRLRQTEKLQKKNERYERTRIAGTMKLSQIRDKMAEIIPRYANERRFYSRMVKRGWKTRRANAAL